MDSIDLVKSRRDYFLVWGHSLKYRGEIVDIIERNSDFEILMLLRHEFKNVRKFVKKIYEHDYVPYFHLKGKTKYLMDTPKEVMFIFVNNTNPREIWKSGHGTGHVESETVVKCKNDIRDIFNERKNDRRTENHVIHASDNEVQVHYMLKYLGYKEGVRLFNRHNDKAASVPYFIEEFNRYQVKKIDVDSIKCNILDNCKHVRVNVSDSPQYKFLQGYEEEYRNYIDKYCGSLLKSYYDLSKYKRLAENFNYLSKGYELNYIIVKRVDESYLVLDGLHRLSMVQQKGYKSVIVLEIL